MGRIGIEDRRRVITLRERGYSFTAIVERFRNEGVSISRISLIRFVRKYKETGKFEDLPRGRPPK